MAIDDNTSYELTGAQVKDLANKIKGKAADNTFVGATPAAPGSKGLVPEPQAGDSTKFLSGDGTWKDVPAGSSYTAGNGIDITNNEISADTNVLATTKLVKDLAGGEQRAGKLIYMFLINTTNGEPVAQELSESVLFVMNNMVYIFAYAETGNLIKSANELGSAISNGAVVEYKSATSDTSDADTDNVVVTSAVGVEDENTGLYSATINLRDLKDFDGKVNSIKVDVSADSTNGLWYKTSKTTFLSGETRFMVEGIFGSSMQQKVLEEIQSTMPEGQHMSPTQLWQMTFLFTDPRTGKLLKSTSDIRSIFRRNNLPGNAILLTSKDSTFENGSIITSYSWSGNATTGFGIMRILCPDTLVSKEYVITATSQHGYTDERQYLWYIIEESTPDMLGISYGFPDASAIDVSTDAPWSTFQTAVDASGNLYMASGSTDVSDWKQINNAPVSVTYYLQKQSTAGLSGISTYIYTDAARTTPAAPATLVADFKAGKTILLEYETNAATPYSITFQVNSASSDGDPTASCQYKLLISELNKDTGTYNAVTTQLSATVTAGTEFNGKWTTVRAVLPTANNGALTIQQNGTTLNTFTANSSDDKTVNIQTITAETVAPAEEVGAVTSSMIDWTTMFVPENITISFGGNSRTAKRFKINATTYAITFHGSTGVTTTNGTTRQITITYPKVTNILCALLKYTVSGQTTPTTGHSSFGYTSADTYVSPVETSGSAVNADLLIIAEMSA